MPGDIHGNWNNGFNGFDLRFCVYHWWKAPLTNRFNEASVLTSCTSSACDDFCCFYHSLGHPVLGTSVALWAAPSVCCSFSPPGGSTSCQQGDRLKRAAHMFPLMGPAPMLVYFWKMKRNKNVTWTQRVNECSSRSGWVFRVQ